jgi:hypothetical protein
MYEKAGEKYFVLDTHTHFWDASPANWRPGAEQYAKGWIECFHAYQSLGPPETHWPLEKFQKYSEEDFVRDMFEEGHVDVAIFQPTYLKEWYRNGFNTTESDGALAAKYPDRLIVNGRWDARDGEAGLRQLEEDAKRYGLKGVKLYTAEWKDGSRGWTLKDDAAKPFFEKCIELGITNIHVHKGPTIWPLDKDAFDVSESTAWRRTTRSSTSSSSTSACRGSRTSASWRRRSPTSTPGSPSSSARSCTPARASSRRSWASCCSGSARTR